MRPIVIVAAIVAFLLQGGFAGAHATNANGHCTNMTVTDYLSSDHIENTTSTAWQNAVDGHLNFTTWETGCVTITFSGEAIAFPISGYEFLHVRTLLDGSSLCVPALTTDIFAEAQQPAPGFSASLTHICKNVAAGVHNVQVQFRGQNGGTVEIRGHTLAVTHN